MTTTTNQQLTDALLAVLTELGNQDTPLNDAGMRFGWNLPEELARALAAAAASDGHESLYCNAHPDCDSAVLHLIGWDPNVVKQTLLEGSGRPLGQASDDLDAAVRAATSAAAREDCFPRMLRGALKAVEEEVGREAIIWHRPGCWEADVMWRMLGYEDHFTVMRAMFEQAAAERS